MKFGAKKHFYEKMTPRQFVRYTRRELRRRRRKNIKRNLKIISPTIFALIIYIWQIIDWTELTNQKNFSQVDGLLEWYLLLLYLFFAFPLFIIVKTADLFGFISEKDQARYEINIFYWGVYIVISVYMFFKIFY